jgi:hypothetical protein
MSHLFYHLGQQYKSSPPAAFEYGGSRYEARLLVASRSHAVAYIYNHTQDLEAADSFERKDYHNEHALTMPTGERFLVSARLGDWLEHAPMVSIMNRMHRVS